jgi:hypothetical protein
LDQVGLLALLLTSVLTNNFNNKFPFVFICFGIFCLVP